MIVDCAHYRDGRRQHEGPMGLDRAAEMCLGDDGFVWLGLFEPDQVELGEVQERFGLHDLAIEDAQSFHLRPKIEQYESGGVVFAVFRTARYVEDREEVEFGEVSVFISRRFVITVRQGIASDLHGARLRLEDRPELLKEGTMAVLWAILDTIVDDYVPVIEGLESDVEEVEATVFTGAAAPTERIYLLRREATDFYRAVHPLLGPLDALERGGYLEVSADLSQFFRDVNDHLKLVNEEVAALRDVLATVLQANMAVISNQQNEISVRQNETDEAAHARRHDLPAAVVHHRLFRDELRMDDRAHHVILGVRRVWPWKPLGLERRHLSVVPPQRPHRLDVAGCQNCHSSPLPGSSPRTSARCSSRLPPSRLVAPNPPSPIAGLAGLAAVQRNSCALEQGEHRARWRCRECCSARRSNSRSWGDEMRASDDLGESRAGSDARPRDCSDSSCDAMSHAMSKHARLEVRLMS